MTQPYQPQVQPQPVRPQPTKKNRRLIWIAIVLGILGLASCGAILNAIGGEDEDATTAQPTPSATEAAETVAAPPAEETTEPAPEPECDQLSKADLKMFKLSAKDRTDIRGGVALPLPKKLQEFNGVTFTRVVGLDVADGSRAIFAAEDDLVDFVGVNKDAIQHFHTLAGMTTRPGTPIQNYRDRLSGSDEVAAVEHCVTAS